MTALPVSVDQEQERRRKGALLKAIGLDRVPPEQREIALAIANRYELDLLLKHLVLVDGRPYITRDGLLHVAHRSGQLDGIEVSDPELVKLDGVGEFWRAKASVYRKDMSRPFVYQGRYPAKGGNQRYAPEMAVKVAEVMALRRAFDVSAPVIEERWDLEAVETAPEPTITENIAARRAAITSGAAGAVPEGPAAEPEPHGTAEPPHPADQAGARTDTPGLGRGSAEAGNPTPAPSAGPGATPLASGSAAQRCEAFSPELGACHRQAGHTGNHANADKETWR